MHSTRRIVNYTNVYQQLRSITGGSTTCGWMCDEVAAFIGSLVRFYRPELVIQTGHLWGKSSLAVLEAFGKPEPLEGLPVGGDAKFSAFVDARRPEPERQMLISIDPEPMGVPNSAAGLAWLKDRYGAAFDNRYQACTSVQFFRHFRTDKRLMGIIDGDHTDDGCRRDIESLAVLNAEMIVVDDTLWLPTLKHVAKDAAARLGYGFAHLPHYNGIALLTKER